MSAGELLRVARCPDCLIVHHKHPGYPVHRESRENVQKKILVKENTGNMEILPKHREFGFLKLYIP